MSELKPSEVLAKAADLIEPEGAWIQRSYARDRMGHFVDYTSPGAACWCAEGAIFRQIPDADMSDVNAVWRFIAMAEPEAHDTPYWNDRPGRTQAEVVAALRKASELAKAEGQ